MISNKNYHNNFDAASDLFDKLRERTFLKTELNIVYTDLANWERAGLLDIGGESNKGEWKKLDYIEYTWLKIIEELRIYGFTYAEIELIKNNLFHIITYDEIKSAMQIDFENVNDIVDKTKIDMFNSIDEKEFNMALKRSLLEQTIAEIITKAEQTSILFFKDIPGAFIPISTESFRGFEKINSSDEIQGILARTFLSISISDIIANFLTEGKGAFEKRTISILTKAERDLLKHIRKRYATIKSINIRFNDNRMDIVEITTIKKAKLESRLLEHIKKGDYLSISIDTVDGNIVHFENTQKIKVGH